MPFSLNKFAKLLSTIDRNGDFKTSGIIETFLPRLIVEGVGSVSLPLTLEQSGQIFSVSEQAPYGKGGKTLLDTAVRNTRQIPPDRIRIEGRHWAETLQNIVILAVEGLGVREPVAAEFYKLLIYDTGGFFLDHRDTEKIPGMFATLVIALPSAYTGGELIVHHKGKASRIDLQTSDPSELSFAAFYADCVHEVEPVTSGCRLTLVYNLKRVGTDQLPTPPDYQSETDNVIKFLKDWVHEKGMPDSSIPEKIIYPLEHAYTPAELSFGSLKGTDAAVASVLTLAAEKSGCDLHLALLSMEESGSASYNGSYRSRWKEDEDDESNFEVDEVFDRTLSLSHWQHPEGVPFETESLPFEENELCPENALDNLEELEESFHEATGNEGASFERSYQSAALVLWPRDRKMSVIHRAGLAISIPFLDKLIWEWENAHSGQKSLLEKQAEELSALIINSWTVPERLNPWSSELKLTPRMLNLLLRLGNENHIVAFIERHMVPPVYGHKDNEALIGTIRLLPSSRFSSLMTNLIEKNAESALEACADLFKRWARSDNDQEQKMPLEKSAETLVEVLTGKNPKFVKEEKPVFIVNLLEALERIAPHLSIRSSRYILENPETYGLDESLIPAVLVFLNSKGNEPSPSFKILRTHCLDRLRERAASLLEPPKDWVRFSKISCKCPDCKILREFLADPDRGAWSFKAAESRREHIIISIQKDRLDLDSTTEKKSRPYTLVCTKNSASYEKLLKQRKKDLENIARMEGD